MADTPALDALLRRDRAITIAGLAVLCVLAWLYLLSGAGLGMSIWEMTTASLFPHTRAAAPEPMAMPDMPGMDMGMDMAGMAPMTETPAPWTVSAWALAIAMWWVMMIAMMTPSAAPAILLYAQVHRHAVAQGQIETKVAPTGAFAAGYLFVWLAFSVAATCLYWLADQSGLVSAGTMGSQSRWLSAGVLIAAGLYQLSPLKNVCLAHCRAPSQFLSEHWRPGATGAFRLGVLHGAYCVGCCWMLMALLFVGGVMNLIWIAAIAVLVLIEKVAPAGQWLGRGAGLVLVAWGVATLMV
jgi:predicted metal-binding membrane protein